MMKNIVITTHVLWGICTSVDSQKRFELKSPSGDVALKITNLADGLVNYSVVYKTKSIIEPSSLDFVLNKPEISFNKFTTESVDSTNIDENWKLVWGEVNSIRNHYKQLTLNLKSPSGVLVKAIFKKFDIGVRFRNEFPEINGFKHFIVKYKLTQFNLSGNHKSFWNLDDYDTNEYLYNTTLLSEINATQAAKREKDIALQSVIGANTLQCLLMMKTKEGIYVNIQKAALVNYPVMHLTHDKNTFTFSYHLVPDVVGNKANLQTPTKTPLRTINISDKATDILELKMILNPKEPSKIVDVSLIKPQKFIGMRWEMHVGKATWDKASGKHGAYTERVITYIDLAALNGFDGVLVEGWNEGWEDRFGNWKENVFDFVTPNNDYDVDFISKYAKNKGVKIIMHHETSGSVTNYEGHIEDAFKFLKKHDKNTVKTGYEGRIIPRGEHQDEQWMVNHYERVVQKAAENQILVEAHEPAKPTGLHCTYPNWLANEAAREDEFNNASTLALLPEHETILPFTRLMGGPMDYTPGFFHFQLNQYDPSRKQEVCTTLANNWHCT